MKNLMRLLIGVMVCGLLLSPIGGEYYFAFAVDLHDPHAPPPPPPPPPPEIPPPEKPPPEERKKEVVPIVRERVIERLTDISWVDILPLWVDEDMHRGLDDIDFEEVSPAA